MNKIIVGGIIFLLAACQAQKDHSGVKDVVSSNPIAIEVDGDEFNVFTPFDDNGFAGVTLAGNSGFIDKSGNFHPGLEPRAGRTFDLEFDEDTTRVYENRKVGFVNRRGEYLPNLSPRFDQAKRFHEGLAMVRIGKNFNYVDKQGELLVEGGFDLDSPGLDPFGDFSDGFACVTVQEPNGYVSRFLGKDGNFLGQTGYQQCESFSEGFAAVKVDNKWGFINTSGQYLKQPHYEFVRSFADGFALVDSGSGWSFIDTRGRSPSSTLYSWMNHKFAEGVVGASHPSVLGFGFVDGATGEFLTNLKGGYEEVGHFSEGFAAVTGFQTISAPNKPRGKYVRKDGSVLSGQAPGAYHATYPFSEGRAVVKLDGLFGVIDDHGNYVVEPGYDRYGGVGIYKNEMIPLRLPDRTTWHYVNRDGDVILVFKLRGT